MQCFSHLYKKLKCHVWNSSKMLSLVTHLVIETFFKTYNTRTCCYMYALLLCCKKKKPKKPTATCTFVTRSKRQKGAFLFMNYVFLIRNKWKFLIYCSYIYQYVWLKKLPILFIWVFESGVILAILHFEKSKQSTCYRKTL